MTPEAQRIAIAEACGWIREYADVPTWDNSVNSYKGGYEPVRTMLFRRKEKCFRAENLPDYLNDLNAMHGAEKMLTDEQDLEYSESLEQVIGARFNSNNGEDMRRLRSATAPQRAEAFLRTLGKWEDGA